MLPLIPIYSPVPNS